jgi:hypothetical protein
MFLSKAFLGAAGLALLVTSAAFAQTTEEPASDAKSSLTRKEADAILNESLTWLNRAKDLLRIASARLPELIKENVRFRDVDRAVELCREETYPAVAAAERLKKNPRLLRSNIQLYTGMRLLQLRCLVLSERLGCPPTPETANMSTQMLDLSNRFGRLTLKLHPYVYKVIDSYESAAPSARIDSMIPLEGEGSF